MQIIPTVLTNDFIEAEQRIKQLVEYAKWIQIDVIDGSFCPFKTFELELLNKLDVTKTILWDVHLMVKEPEKWLEKCLFIGASRVTGQVEMMSDREKFVDEIKNMGVDVGLSFDVDTEIENIPKETDLVLLMGRKSGFQSTKFDEKIYKKITKLVEFKKNKKMDFEIGIDGGLNEEIIKKIKVVGTDIAYCGGIIFNGNVINNWEKINYASNN